MDFEELSVLVVDDEVFMRGIVSRLLRDLGTREITEARDGAEGLKAIAERSTAFDVILLDLHMPKIGGADFLRYLRNSDDQKSNDVPVIVLTGDAQAGTVSEIAALDVQGYLVKPVSKKDLTLRIAKVVASREGADT